MTPFYVLAALAVAMLIIVTIVHKRRNALPQRDIERLRRHWERVEKMDDDDRKVMEADKVIDMLLDVLGYEGTFGEKLKRAGPRLVNEQDVWDAHKLRNRIAHEPDVTVTDAQARRAVRSFKRALDTFME